MRVRLSRALDRHMPGPTILLQRHSDTKPTLKSKNLIDKLPNPNFSPLKGNPACGLGFQGVRRFVPLRSKGKIPTTVFQTHLQSLLEAGQGAVNKARESASRMESHQNLITDPMSSSAVHTVLCAQPGGQPDEHPNDSSQPNCPRAALVPLLHWR